MENVFGYIENDHVIAIKTHVINSVNANVTRTWKIIGTISGQIAAEISKSDNKLFFFFK